MIAVAYFLERLDCSYLIFPFFIRVISEQGGDPLKRNENDASALQAKVAAKQAAAAAAAVNDPSGSAAPIVPKKATAKKADAGLDDLLNAGLTGGKKK